MRITREEYFLSIAKLASLRSTCLSRQVGCVMTNSRNHIVSVGYNGFPPGMNHCLTCDKENCLSIHSEMNALIQCPDVFSIDTCYTTVSPCRQCLKMLLSTSCKKIVFITEYPDAKICKCIWENAGRIWECQENHS
jgi:dCMP deaminase